MTKQQQIEKQDQIDALTECVMSEVTIECERCSTVRGALYEDEVSFAEIMYKKGWRFLDDKALCPKCSKKINK